MVTEESLQEQYAKMETDDLLRITANKSGYTELAISVAIEELKKRGITEDQIRKTGEIIHEQANKLWMENCLFDLSFLQKMAYYFILWMPRLRIYFTKNFKQNGYLLKNDQSNYYSLLGFLFLIITFIFSVLFNSSFLPVSLWPIGFLLSYLFDINFNKQRQIKNLQKIKDEGELPIEYS
jgi:hypothetical protein